MWVLIEYIKKIKNLLRPHKCSRQLKVQRFTNRKKWLYILFIVIMGFAMFFSEFVLAFSSPHQPLQAYAYFLDNNKGSNAIANALGKITITENAHLLLKGSGRYTLEVRDTNGTVLFSRKGIFNKTGYAEIVFRISPEKFKVGETYNIRINATDNPFPLFYRYAETHVKFTVERDYPVIALGAIRDENQTLITARIFTDAGPLKNKKICFAYKQYNEKEKLKRIGFAFSDEEGRATLVTNILNETRLYLVVAEFYGDELYKPSAAAQPYTPIVRSKDYKKHDTLLNFLNSTSTVGKESPTSTHTNKAARKGGMGRIISTSMSYKTSELGSRFSKTTASDRIKSNVNSTYTFEFIETNLASLSLVEFLKRITTDDTPASALINIANILMNLDDIPFVIAQTQELLSKLQVPLIPDVAHSSFTEIRLYRSTFYTETVEKTIVEKHTETYTITKKVSKKVAYTKTITKRIKIRVQYIAYEKRTRQEMVFVRRPRPHWQVVYVTEYKPVTKWKYVWKTVKQTVTRYKTVTYTVTEKKTRTYYTHKTVTEKVKKEKREYFKIILTDFTVINEQTGEKMSLQQFFLFVMGFREDTLSMIIRYMEAKVFGPALDMLQQFIDFLINVNKRFLRALITKLFDELRSLLFHGLMIAMVKSSRTANGKTKNGENIATIQNDQPRDTDYLFAPSGRTNLFNIDPVDRKYFIWDSLDVLQGPKSNEMAESTKFTIELNLLEAQALRLTGTDDVVIVPATSEVLVYNSNHEKNKRPEFGWLDLNHYDHTIAKIGDYEVFDWYNENKKIAKKSMGYIPLGVIRTTYIIFVPSEHEIGGRKLVIGYAIEKISDNTNLVPKALLEFPDLLKDAKGITVDTNKLYNSFFEEHNYLLREVLGTDKLETYGDLREAVAKKYNIKDIYKEINYAIDNCADVGTKIVEVSSEKSKVDIENGIKVSTTSFFIVNPDFEWTDSGGEKHTPIDIPRKLFLKDACNSESKYRGAIRTLRGLIPEIQNKKLREIKLSDYFVERNEAVNIGKAIFYRIAYIAKKNNIPANGILRVISPALLNDITLDKKVSVEIEISEKEFTNKIKNIKIRGQSDEFHNNIKAMTIINPRYANPKAAIFLDLFRSFVEGAWINTRRSAGNEFSHSIGTRLRFFRKSIADAYLSLALFDQNPKEIKFNIKYRVGNKVKSTCWSMADLMRHYNDFRIVVGGNDREPMVRKIEIDGVKIPADEFIEGLTYLRFEEKANEQVQRIQLNREGKKIELLKVETLTIYMLDENLKPIGNKITFDIVEIIENGKKRAGKRILLSENGEYSTIIKERVIGMALWRLELSKLVRETLKQSYKRLVKNTPELEWGYLRLLGDMEYLGQNPTKTAQYLLLLAAWDTEGFVGIHSLSKRYVDTVIRSMQELKKTKDLLDREGIKSTNEQFSKKVYERISNEIKKFDNDHIKYLMDSFRSVDKVTHPKKKKSIERVEEGKKQLTITLQIAEEYIERMLKKEEWDAEREKGTSGIKQLGTSTVVGTVVGLIFPRVIGQAIMTLDFAIVEELLNRDAKGFLSMLANDKTRLAIGVCLSTVAFALFNMDADRFIKKATENTNHKSSVVDEFFGQMFNLKMVFGTFISGFGMILEALFDAPFYTTDEIATEISKLVHEKLGDVAGKIWDTTIGYRVPGLDMTVFEIALTVLLEGNGGIIELITTVTTKVVEYLLSEIIKPLVEPVIAEYTYYLAAALLL